MQSLPSVLVPLPSANCRNVGRIHVEKIGGVKHKIKTLKSISNPISRLFYLFFEKLTVLEKFLHSAKYLLSLSV